MKTKTILITAAGAALCISCAAAVPPELSNAREAYRRANAGDTARIAPAELHVAELALAEAEKSFRDNPEMYITRDLAYIAERKIQIAEATASIITEKENQSQANNDYRKEQKDALKESQQNLSQTQKDLSESQQNSELTKEELAAEKKARILAEQQAANALASLAKLAAVKEEPRGMVITLSGSVLFRSGKADLLPEARTRLDAVAKVLLTTRERHLIVEGHTDSQGSDSYNMDLSQRRADAVRSYLVQRDYQSDRIMARGHGEEQPIADNDSAEGRANNRRVEIIVEPGSTVANR